MDTEEKGHELTPGFRNEMPKKAIERTLETENQEYRYHEKNGHKHQYCSENY